MDITGKILKRAGYDVCCAEGAAGAKEELAKMVPDALILEGTPSGEVGIGLCRELKDVSGVPLIYLSSDKEDELPALRAGADDFLKKPFDFEVFKARLGVLLGGFEAGKKGPAWGKKVKISVSGLYVAAAACVVIALGSFGIMNALNMNINRVNNDANEITDENSGGSAPAVFEVPEPDVPLGGALNMFPSEDAAAKPYTESENGAKSPEYLIPHYERVKIFAETGEADMTLLNPEGNFCDFVFEIVLEDSGEGLYKSGLVGPGMCLEGFMLGHTPPKGEYIAVLKIDAYKAGMRVGSAGGSVRFVMIVE